MRTNNILRKIKCPRLSLSNKYTHDLHELYLIRMCRLWQVCFQLALVNLEFWNGNERRGDSEEEVGGSKKKERQERTFATREMRWVASGQTAMLKFSF